MKANLAIFISCVMVGWGCSTTTQAPPLAAIPPEPPNYIVVQHPDGLDLGDLRAIFFDKSAPPAEALKDCNADFVKLQARTRSNDELLLGAREFVRLDPTKYHWCFYSKLLELEEQLKTDSFIDERQKHVLATYGFLTPIARAFLMEYQDSRYLRWAVTRYRTISEYVFYRRVELSPQAAVELLSASNPLGNLRPPKDTEMGVLEKYGIVSDGVIAPGNGDDKKSTYPVDPATAAAVKPDTAPAGKVPFPDPATFSAVEKGDANQPVREPAAEPTSTAPSF
jgi:hypothetical protein